MNQGILAARTQQALDRIAQETQRLGGLLIIQPTRGDAAHRQLHVLEAIVEALRGIENPPAPDGAALTPSPAKGKAKA